MNEPINISAMYNDIYNSEILPLIILSWICVFN